MQLNEQEHHALNDLPYEVQLVYLRGFKQLVACGTNRATVCRTDIDHLSRAALKALVLAGLVRFHDCVDNILVRVELPKAGTDVHVELGTPRTETYTLTRTTRPC